MIGVVIISLILIVVALEDIFKPRLDRLITGERILWYGKKNRKYIILK